MINPEKFIREPLIHFLLIGAALFLFYYLQNGINANIDNRIVINEADIDRLITIWAKKRQRLPTQQELKGLIEQQIHEEVMYREALALGLDKNDGIVHRRMAQKMEFIFSDIAAQSQPDESDLIKYLDNHSDKFKIPGRISFQHVYFNIDKHGDQIEKDIQQVLARLTQAKSKIDINEIGDAFMLGQEHKQLTEYDVSRIFGKNFAKTLFTLSVNSWQGPIKSGYGLHLINIENKTQSKKQKLDNVRDKVRSEWLSQQNKKLNDNFYKSLRQRYEIVINYSMDNRDN
jgi:hypothetical protein